jgi:hypothetical protein
MNTPERNHHDMITVLRDGDKLTPGSFEKMERAVMTTTMERLAAGTEKTGKRDANDISLTPGKEQAENDAATGGGGARLGRLSFASSQVSPAAENVAGSGLTTDGANGTTSSPAERADAKLVAKQHVAVARRFYLELLTEKPEMLTDYSSTTETLPLIDDVHKLEPSAELDEDEEREDEDEENQYDDTLNFYFADNEGNECESEQKLGKVVAAKLAHAMSLELAVLEQIFVFGCARAKQELNLSNQGLAAICGARQRSMNKIATGTELLTINARAVLRFLIAFFIIFKSTTLTLRDIFTLGVSRISRDELLKDQKNLSTTNHVTSTKAKTGKWGLLHSKLLVNTKGKLRAAIMTTGDAMYTADYGMAIVAFTWSEILSLEDALSRKCVAFGEVAWKERALIYVRKTWVSGKSCLIIKKFWKVDNSKKITPPNDVARDAARAAAAAADHAGAATLA